MVGLSDPPPMNLSSFFNRKSSPRTSTSSSSSTPRLDRSNASRYIDYCPSPSPSSSRSLPPSSSSCSIRIDGLDALDSVCRFIGLSSPDDFAVDPAAWELHKSQRSLPPSLPPLPPENPPSSTGIRGSRPPMLAPPPPFRPTPTAAADDFGSSAWDLVRSFGPHGGRDRDVEDGASATWSVGDGDAATSVSLLVNGMGGDGTAATWSFSTVNDDDSSSTTTEGFSISPNVRSVRLIGAWSKGKELGRGSFGTVYEAITEEGGFFAVKEISLGAEFGNLGQSAVDLEREIGILSQCEHENIVRYLGTEKKEEKFYIFLELVTQGSLVSLYNKYHLQDTQVSAYTRQILHGLQYLHDRNVIHRDIKCANILVAASGSAKLADFGLAKQTTRFQSLKSCRGSICWMAPEVVVPDKSYGPPADIWSLGCTVLEMLTRKPPYMSDQQPSDDRHWVRIFYMIGKGVKPEIPESLSFHARDFIDRCIQVDPSDRWSAADLLEHPFVKRESFVFNSPGSPFRRQI